MQLWLFRTQGPVLLLQHDTVARIFSQWECSFHWKLRCHWLEFLQQRQIAVVRQDPGPYVWYKSNIINFTFYFCFKFNSPNAGDGIFWLWRSIPCLLMHWLLKALQYQLICYWLCRTGNMYCCLLLILSAWVKSNLRYNSKCEYMFYNL